MEVNSREGGGVQIIILNIGCNFKFSLVYLFHEIIQSIRIVLHIHDYIVENTTGGVAQNV